MKISELAKQLELPLVETKALLSDLGLDPDANEIDERLAQSILAKKAAVQPQIEAEPTPQEKPKRGRKKTDSQLAKKAASDLENSAAGASEVQATFTTSAATLRAQEMLACADVVAATGYAAFTARLAQNDAAFLSWFAKGTNEAIANNSNAANPAQILASLGIPSAQESLGKLQQSSVSLSNAEEAETALRFYDNSAA
ncbi:MAG: hypothetical protein ACM37W_20895 [Actinomycetota bacterium]